MIRFILNENEVSTSLPPGMVLLDFIRYHQHLTGTKIGCREGDCGACTVLVGTPEGGSVSYRSMTSCLVPLGNIAGKHIVTIEGINDRDGLTPLQQAMADEGATQCGFCTPGFVLSLAAFCLGNKPRNAENAIASIDGNICRCTGYKSIERAAARIADRLNQDSPADVLSFAVTNKILPSYFKEIHERLKNIQPVGLVHSMDHLAPTIVGGGTDLYVQKHDEMNHASLNLSFDNPDLKGISRAGNICAIGGAVTVTDLLESPVIREAFPFFSRYAKLISSTPIRNMATVAGNFVNASPIGDLTIFFLALNARVELQNTSNGQDRRTIPLRNFYKGYKQLNKAGTEIVTRIFFDLPGAGIVFHFEKVSKRTHLDIASVNSAIRLQVADGLIKTAALSAGGVAPIPVYLAKTGAFMEGKEITWQMIDDATAVMQTEISPISDTRGTKEYKRLLLTQLLKAHFISLFPKLETAE